MENEYEDDEQVGEPHTFIVVWDMYGLEAVLDITKMEMAEVFTALQTGQRGQYKKDWQQILNAMSLRARMNGPRHYEIYGVQATPGISESDIQEMFENSPQIAADTIRRLGVVIYSDRAKDDNKVVIR